MCKSISVLLFGLLLIPRSSHSQKSGSTYKRFRVSPLPVIYYSPETRLGFGGLVAVSFDTQKIPDALTRTSYSQTYFLYTLNNQHDLGHMTRIYFPENKWVKFIGLDVWVGAALTTDTWYEFFDNPIKPNAGIGLRVMINRKDKLNVRADQGFGNQGQSGFYLDISEAF